jgi:hypothetical protein
MHDPVTKHIGTAAGATADTRTAQAIPSMFTVVKVCYLGPTPARAAQRDRAARRGRAGQGHGRAAGN